MSGALAEIGLMTPERLKYKRHAWKVCTEDKVYFFVCESNLFEHTACYYVCMAKVGGIQVDVTQRKRRFFHSRVGNFLIVSNGVAKLKLLSSYYGDAHILLLIFIFMFNHFFP